MQTFSIFLTFEEGAKIESAGTWGKEEREDMESMYLRRMTREWRRPMFVLFRSLFHTTWFRERFVNAVLAVARLPRLLLVAVLRGLLLRPGPVP